MPNVLERPDATKSQVKVSASKGSFTSEGPRRISITNIESSASGTRHLDKVIDRLISRWKENLPPTSNPTIWYQAPEYKAIIALGRVAVPFILEAIAREPQDLFEALHQITGHDPVPEKHYGDMEAMTGSGSV